MFDHLYLSNTLIGYNPSFLPSKQARNREGNDMFFGPSFTGKETDCETGFSYFGARYYDPSLLTSWTAVDPMADKYPNLCPYNYCAWNPMKLVDPDGMDAVENDDWYQDGQGYVRWDANVHSQSDLKEGEHYIGKTVLMLAEESNQVIYGDQYGRTWESVPLKEVSITEKLTDHERTLHNPLVQTIHQSAYDFWGHPVSQAAIDATLFVVTGGTECAFSYAAKTSSKAIAKYQAKRFFKNAEYSNKVKNAMMAGMDNRHAFPSCVDAYAAKYGEFTIQRGSDGIKYQWLTLKGGYGNTIGTFEYIKDSKGVINHRFLNGIR